MNIKQSSGFAMIEVLLAVVVLALGLLAGSKMQMLGLNYTQGAQMRTNATMAANDIIDRMRVNSQGVLDGAYDDADTDSPPANPNCIAIGCTPAQLAAHDIRVWSAYFGQGNGSSSSTPLSGAQGTISRNDTTGLYAIEITWSELIHGETEDDQLDRKITVGVDFN